MRNPNQTDLFPVTHDLAELPALNRAAGLSHLKAYIPLAGQTYTKRRNFDKGQGKHHAVSRLSGHLRRRLITEEEVLRLVAEHHPGNQAEKFILEVFWRSYFKGWLANRPSIWNDFCAYQLPDAQQELYQKAISGQTGIACFDAWVDELKTSHYLHNHARMWFASIWIFTLGLDWQSGAGFFMRYLRDFCPASNTLGWRWTAGLHTVGKHYVATANNIHTFTEGRFSVHGQLNEMPEACAGSPHPQAVTNLPDNALLQKDYLLLVTAEDCHLESLNLAHPPKAVLSLPAKMGDKSWDEKSQAVRDAKLLLEDAKAIEDAALRAQTVFGCAHHNLSSITGEQQLSQSVLSYASEAQCTQIVCAYQGVGFWQKNIDALFLHLQQNQLETGMIVRRIDRLCIPAAKKGFFPFKSNIPKWMGEICA